VGITESQTDDAGLVRLEGVIDIAVAAELAAELKDALGRGVAEGKPVRIEVEGVTGLDVTAWQLLWAAQRDAGRKGIEFSLAGEMPEPVQSLLECVGLEDAGAPQGPEVAGPVVKGRAANEIE
jgi:anti-anti-sigma regulatory factor